MHLFLIVENLKYSMWDYLGEIRFCIFYEACEINGFFVCYEIIKYYKHVLLRLGIFKNIS
jgi:hypothetical protein